MTVISVNVKTVDKYVFINAKTVMSVMETGRIYQHQDKVTTVNCVAMETGL